MDRLCTKCGQEIPTGTHGNRKMCDECRKVNKLEYQRGWWKRHNYSAIVRVRRNTHLSETLEKE